MAIWQTGNRIHAVWVTREAVTKESYIKIDGQIYMRPSEKTGNRIWEHIMREEIKLNTVTKETEIRTEHVVKEKTLCC